MITREEQGLEALPGRDIPHQGLGLDAGQNSSFQSLCMQQSSSGFQGMHSPHSAPTDYLFMIRNVINIFGKSIVWEMAEGMPGWTLQPREAS